MAIWEKTVIKSKIMIMESKYADIKGRIFDIQPFSVHDGPGIRTTVFLKGCPLRCVWCHNPESNNCGPELMLHTDKCTGCGRCLEVCPSGAVRTGGDGTVVTDRALCTQCGECVKVCEYGAREITGKEESVQEVMDAVLKDRLFMETSGGGVTISGGEPLMQPAFTAGLAAAFHDERLHVAVETSGFTGSQVLRSAFRDIDLILYDIKAFDEDLHIRCTGVSNRTILENAVILKKEMHKDMVIRIPSVPGYNLTPDNIRKTGEFVARSLGTDVPVHLLPYHNLGEGKKESLGRNDFLDVKAPGNDELKEYTDILNGLGLAAQIGGSM